MPQSNDCLVEKTNGDLMMESCPLCPAKHGEDYYHYSKHVRDNHDLADVGLEPQGVSRVAAD